MKRAVNLATAPEAPGLPAVASGTVVNTMENPALVMRRAGSVATVCREIVLRSALQIQGRRYVPVEGWQSIATAFGCSLSACDVERIEGGWRAVGEVRRLSDGLVVARADGFLGDDESSWSKRPTYAKRAMTQTRAMSRAARSAFAFVLLLIDSNLATVPAEEIAPDGFAVEHRLSQEPAPAKRSLFGPPPMAPCPADGEADRDNPRVALSELAALVAPDGEVASAILLAKGWLGEGETWQDLPPDRVGAILKQPARFRAAIAAAKMEEAR